MSARKGCSLGSAGWLALLFILAPLQPGFAASVGVVWLGNDTHGDVFATDTDGNVLHTVAGIDVTGIAFDGSSLYFSDRASNFTRRTPDGQTVLDSFFVSSELIGEDLAWDTNRNRLWRIDHSNRLDRINPVSGMSDFSFNLPTAHAGFSRLGGLGVAYDGSRDLLYVSFCEFGCGNLVQGLVVSFDPDTLAVADVFTTSGFATGGLGYDPVTDSLWVGDNTVVRNMSLGGAVLDSFARPQVGGFVDGLEFIPAAVPEPGALSLLLLAAPGLLLVKRRSRRNPKNGKASNPYLGQ
jgi:DNA-binding beta-propeller fold protein YncE